MAALSLALLLLRDQAMSLGLAMPQVLGELSLPPPAPPPSQFTESDWLAEKNYRESLDGLHVKRRWLLTVVESLDSPPHELILWGTNGHVLTIALLLFDQPLSVTAEPLSRFKPQFRIINSGEFSNVEHESVS